MEERLKQIFYKTKCDPETDLANNIWNTICTRNKKIASLKLFTFSVVGVASLAGLVPAVQMLTRDFAQSGFYEYLSLAFSNTGAVMSFWREFIFSLAEALPLTSIILSLGLIFVFFLSLRYAMKQIPREGLTLSFKA